jgi:hypothetical protein
MFFEKAKIIIFFTFALYKNESYDTTLFASGDERRLD